MGRLKVGRRSKLIRVREGTEGWGGGRAWESKRFYDGGGLKKQGFCWRICLGDSRTLQPFFWGGGLGSVTKSVIQVCNEVLYWVTDTDLNFFSELTTVTDTDTTDFIVFELDM